MNIVSFYENFFRFTKKFLPLLITQLFFEIFLAQPPAMFSTDFNWSVICSFTKRVWKISIKRDSTPKHFLEVTKGIERLQQNASDKLRFSDPDSEQAQWQILNLLKLKIVTTCFEQYTFHSNLQNNVYGQVYCQKHFRLLPKQEFIEFRLFCGGNFIYKTFQEIAAGRVTFNIVTI